MIRTVSYLSLHLLKKDENFIKQAIVEARNVKGSFGQKKLKSQLKTEISRFSYGKQSLEAVLFLGGPFFLQYMKNIFETRKLLIFFKKN